MTAHLSQLTYPDRNGHVRVKYHQEDAGWWGEVDGWHWSCAAPTLDECRQEAREGLPFCIDERLVAKTVLFVHWTGVKGIVSMNPAADETFRFYVSEEAQ